MRMRNSKALAVVFLATSSVLARQAPAPATTQDADVRALVEEIKQLRSRVEQLEQRVPTAAEIDATKAKINNDVLSKQTRVNAKYDQNGLLIGTEDGTFTLRPSITATLRYAYNHAENATGRDRDNDGFEVRRLKFNLQGTALTKQLSYAVETTTGANGGGLTLNDAFVTYRTSEDGAWFIRGGQFKNPLWHEELTSDSTSVAAEPSLINETIGGRATGRIQGAGLVYNNYQLKDNPINAFFVINDGDKSINTDYLNTTTTSSSGVVDSTANFGATARVEYKAFGPWSSYSNLSHLDSKEDLLVFGAASSMSQGGDRNVVRFVTDAQYEFAEKWALYAGLIAADSTNGAGPDSFDYGGMIQLAYILTPNVEVFTRYDGTFYDNLQANGADRAQEITVGLNYLLGPEGKFWRQARLTLDFTYLPDGSPAAFGSENILQAGGSEYVTRIQFRFIL